MHMQLNSITRHKLNQAGYFDFEVAGDGGWRQRESYCRRCPAHQCRTEVFQQAVR